MNSHPPVTEQKVVVAAQPTSHIPSLETVGGYAGAILAIATMVTLIYNLLMRDVKRDIKDASKEIESVKTVQKLEFDTIRHSHKNLKAEVQSLEHLRTGDVERIIKLETNLTNLEKGQERIESRLDTMAEDSAAARKEIIDTIREMRTTTIKGA